MNKNTNEKLTFFKWIHKYRAKIGLMAFIIAIPVALLLITYLGPYVSNQSVHFDEEKTDVQRRFQSIDDLDELTFTITWKQLIKPQYDDNDPSEIVSIGQFRFDINYEAKGAYNITSVAVTPVLHPDWFSFYSIGAKKTVTTTPSIMAIVWNEELPLQKLLFITVNEPNLYLKVEYTYMTADQPVSKTAYIEYSLAGINPEVVTTN